MEDRETRAYVAEFLGTFLLVLFIGFVVSLTTKEGLGFADFAVIGLVHFFVLAMLIATLGSTSGAHFNPAVTVTLAALKKIKPADAVIYILLQVAGAIAAALVVKLLLNDVGKDAAYGGVQISEKLIEGKVLSAFLIELIGTFVLMWAILGTAVTRRTELAPLFIGGTLALAVMALAPMTGAGFNPARAFGPDLVGAILDDVGIGKFLLAYVAGPIVGALLAGFGHQYLVGEGARPIDTLE
ncbi:MAG TPA: aquaporin [Baekduia sp.]|nr:aquaporin [Baekduia sp.]